MQIPPVLRGVGLSLRPLAPADAEPIQRFCAEAAVARMTAAIPHPYPQGAGAKFVAAVRAGRWPEEVRAVDAGAGLVGVIGLKPAQAEIGYWIGRPHWGRGLASAAVELLAGHLLGPGGVEALTARVRTDNPASMRVLARAGFEPCGRSDLYPAPRDRSVQLVHLRCDRASRAGRLAPPPAAQ